MKRLFHSGRGSRENSLKYLPESIPVYMLHNIPISASVFPGI
jgi:hypothetical protein